MRDFRRLHAWKRAHDLVLDVYQATATYPSHERFGLTLQTRKSVSSIPFNICEGCGAESEAEYARYLGISIKSSSELEYQILLARDLGYLDADHHNDLVDRVGQVRAMLLTIRRGLRRGPG